MKQESRRRLVALMFCLVPAAAGCAHHSTGGEEEAARIRLALEQWAHDFNAGDAEAACALFAPDLVAAYAGGPERDRNAMCRSLRALLTDRSRIHRYDPPRIEEIRVAGGLATVRLHWTLRIGRPGQPGGSTIRESGLDVFQRQADGSWKIAISHAYTESETGDETAGE